MFAFIDEGPRGVSSCESLTDLTGLLLGEFNHRRFRIPTECLAWECGGECKSTAHGDNQRSTADVHAGKDHVFLVSAIVQRIWLLQPKDNAVNVLNLPGEGSYYDR